MIGVRLFIICLFIASCSIHNSVFKDGPVVNTPKGCENLRIERKDADC